MKEKEQGRLSRQAMRHPFIFLLSLGCAASCLLLYLYLKGKSLPYKDSLKNKGVTITA